MGEARHAIHTLAAGLGCLRKALVIGRLKQHSRHVLAHGRVSQLRRARHTPIWPISRGVLSTFEASSSF